jgi:protease secretion system membrane fusion protein
MGNFLVKARQIQDRAGSGFLKFLERMESLIFGLGKVEDLSPEMAYVRIGMRILIYGFCGFILWAAFAPLDKGSPASGIVVKEGSIKTIQHVSGGIIDEVLVKDGDVVSEGQVLIKVNPTLALSQVNSIRESMKGLEAQSKQLELSMQAKNKQLQVMKGQIEGLRALDKENYIPRAKLWDAERESLRVEDALQSDKGNLERNRSQIAEFTEKLKNLEFDLSNVEIKSPVNGTVVGLSVFTRGGIITPNTRLLEIVPSNDRLVIDAQLPVQLIDKVYPNLEVELMFTSFNQNLTPKAFGKVINVSADRLTDEKNGFSYYKIRVELTEESAKKLAKYNIRPGMPVEVFVKTGERTLFSYIFKPLIDRMHSALREE